MQAKHATPMTVCAGLGRSTRGDGPRGGIAHGRAAVPCVSYHHPIQHCLLPGWLTCMLSGAHDVWIDCLQAVTAEPWLCRCDMPTPPWLTLDALGICDARDPGETQPSHQNPCIVRFRYASSILYEACKAVPGICSTAGQLGHSCMSWQGCNGAQEGLRLQLCHHLCRASCRRQLQLHWL